MKVKILEIILFMSFTMKMKLIKVYLKKPHLTKVKTGDVVAVGSCESKLKNLIRNRQLT